MFKSLVPCIIGKNIITDQNSQLQENKNNFYLNFCDERLGFILTVIFILIVITYNHNVLLNCTLQIFLM